MPRINKNNWIDRKKMDEVVCKWFSHDEDGHSHRMTQEEEELIYNGHQPLYDYVLDLDKFNDIPLIKDPSHYKNKEIMIGHYIHHYIASRKLGREPLFHNFNIPHEVTIVGEAILRHPLMKNILGVEVKIPHAHLKGKYLFYDAVFCSNESGDSGPEEYSIIDYKYTKNLDTVNPNKYNMAQCLLYLESWQKKRKKQLIVDDVAGENPYFYLIFCDGKNTKTYEYQIHSKNGFKLKEKK
jgi:hypothetical protein